jgi:hypothetical protein
MNLFVLGSSAAGKTPFARQIALALGVQHVSASEWVKRLFPAGAHADRNAYVEAITRFSLAELARRPDACVAFLHQQHDLTRPTVIDGIRNPHDFVHLFDPRRDRVVFLELAGNAVRKTDFEDGLEVIRSYLAYLAKTGLLADPGRVRHYRFLDYCDPVGSLPSDNEMVSEQDGVRQVLTLDAAIRDYLRELRGIEVSPGSETEEIPSRPQRVHAEIPPLKTHVRAEYLYDMDPAHIGEVVPCWAFAVSSYEGSVLTFEVLLDNGSMFSYMPPTALIDPARARGQEVLDLKDLASVNCPSGDICVHRYRALEGTVQGYFKQRDRWLAGDYLCTIDWYQNNQLVHLIALENGQYALLPSHKVLFGDGTRVLPGYRKMHSVWQV